MTKLGIFAGALLAAPPVAAQAREDSRDAIDVIGSV